MKKEVPFKYKDFNNIGGSLFLPQIDLFQHRIMKKQVKEVTVQCQLIKGSYHPYI